MIRIGRVLCTAVLSSASIAAAQTPSSGQAYPAKPIRIIVPFAPAGPTDNQARWAAQHLNTAFAQPVIVDNRPGGGGVPGTEFVVKAAPDGYTLLAGNPGPLTIAPSARAQMPYDTLRDLAPILLIAKSASCLCAHPSLPARGLKEFAALAKARPGAINYGSPGVGTVGHFATELIATQIAVKLTHVPYKGAAQYTVDLLAGNIEVALNQFAIAAPHVNAGRLRCLGVTSASRSPLLPNTPTMAEQGLSGFESYNWNGLLAPAGTPPAIITRIYDTLAKALKTTEARDLYTGQGHEIGGLAPDQYAGFLRSEADKWARVAKLANIQRQ